jgi:hypothetical protein
MFVVYDDCARAASYKAVIYMNGKDKDVIVNVCIEYAGICIVNAETEVSQGMT